jgi:hypothetical protein
MRNLLRSFVALLIVAAAPVFAGDIQVTCEPGLKVYLDGALAGTSNAREDGLVLTGVPEGPHTIRVEKPGFMPLTFQVVVGRQPIEIPATAFDPVLPAGAGKQPVSTSLGKRVGNLVVTSAPQNCTVEIDGESQWKDAPFLDVGALAPGRHTVAFSKDGFEPVSTVITMQPGAEITVRGDLKNGKVDVVHEGKGSLRVVSTPEYCTVQILGVTRDKTTARLNVSHLPAGEHRMVVSWKGMERSANVLITNGHRTIVTVSFMKNDVPFKFAYEAE